MEKPMNRPQPYKRLLAFALLIALSPALLINTNKAQAATPTVNDKVSPDLRQLIQSGQGASRVRLIVQSKPTSSLGLIGSLLQTVNGVLVATLSTLNLSIVDATANSVDVLAADPSVAFVSLDTQVRSFGHVTTTTGAQQMRAQKNALGLSYTLDGHRQGFTQQVSAELPQRVCAWRRRHRRFHYPKSEHEHVERIIVPGKLSDEERRHAAGRWRNFLRQRHHALGWNHA